MPSRPKVTANKRVREQARRERQKTKALRREQAQARKANTPRPTGSEDPDIAGIVPGPQPSPWADDGFGDDEETEK